MASPVKTACRLAKPTSESSIQSTPVCPARRAQAGALNKTATRAKVMRELKHLPVDEWPEADCEAFRAAYEPGDIFDETAGPGAHLSEGSRRMIRSTYRRWLGFLKTNYPDDFSMPPHERITLERVRVFI